MQCAKVKKLIVREKADCQGKIFLGPTSAFQILDWLYIKINFDISKFYIFLFEICGYPRNYSIL